MTPNRLAGAIMAGIALVAAGSLPVRAGSPNACRNYAEGAIIDFNDMMRHPRCNVRPGGRWQPDYGVHYQWCLHAADEAIDAERNTRIDWLVRCGARVRLDDN